MRLSRQSNVTQCQDKLLFKDYLSDGNCLGLLVLRAFDWGGKSRWRETVSADRRIVGMKGFLGLATGVFLLNPGRYATKGRR